MTNGTCRNLTVGRHWPCKRMLQRHLDTSTPRHYLMDRSSAIMTRSSSFMRLVSPAFMLTRPGQSPPTSQSRVIPKALDAGRQSQASQLHATRESPPERCHGQCSCYFRLMLRRLRLRYLDVELEAIATDCLRCANRTAPATTYICLPCLGGPS